MPDCILHIGTPKTGSTAIQDALFHHLRDPRFQYVSGSHPNGSFAISALLATAENQSIPAGGNAVVAALAAEYQQFTRRFERGLLRARHRRAVPVISAEYLWAASTHQLVILRDRLLAGGFTPRVLGYLRPWRAWIDSWFTQRARYGLVRWSEQNPFGDQLLDVRARVLTIWEVFGRERVALARYDRRTFPGGCVVQDFCRRIGHPFPAGLKLSANESFSLPALQLAYSFHLAGERAGQPSPARRPHLERLLRRLGQVPGPALRLHPDVHDRWMPMSLRQNEWLERELGFSLEDPVEAPPAQGWIHSEAELLGISPTTLDWLARQVQQPVVRLDPEGNTLSEVARQVDEYRCQPATLAEWRHRLREWSLRRWIHWRDGC